MPRPRKYDDAFAATLIEAAGSLLAARGPDAVTVRDVAEAAGATTTAVYSLFDSKADLVAAVVREGFRRFGVALGSAPVTDDARHDLVELGLAYRRFALGDPHFYDVMFLRAPPDDYQPTGEDAQAQDATFDALVTRIARCQEVGALRADRAPDHLAVQVWAMVHGLAALELRGSVDPVAAPELWREALAAQLDGMAPPERP